MKYFILPLMSLVVGLIIAGLITWNNTNNIILIFNVTDDDISYLKLF